MFPSIERGPIFSPPENAAIAVPIELANRDRLFNLDVDQIIEMARDIYVRGQTRLTEAVRMAQEATQKVDATIGAAFVRTKEEINHIIETTGNYVPRFNRRTIAALLLAGLLLLPTVACSSEPTQEYLPPPGVQFVATEAPSWVAGLNGDKIPCHDLGFNVNGGGYIYLNNGCNVAVLGGGQYIFYVSEVVNGNMGDDYKISVAWDSNPSDYTIDKLLHEGIFGDGYSFELPKQDGEGMFEVSNQLGPGGLYIKFKP